MKLFLVGSTGHIGSLVLRRAIEAGHAVTALVRSREKLPADLVSRLNLVVSPAFEPATIQVAADGAEAAIITLAAGHGVLARFDAAALPIFERTGPRRVVSMVGASVRLPGDPESLSLSIMSAMMRMVPGGLLDDAEAHARRLSSSALDWTLVRSTNFSSKEATGRVAVHDGRTLPLSASITRGDLADFIVSSAVNGLYKRQAPMVSNA